MSHDEQEATPATENQREQSETRKDGNNKERREKTGGGIAAANANTTFKPSPPSQPNHTSSSRSRHISKKRAGTDKPIPSATTSFDASIDSIPNPPSTSSFSCDSSTSSISPPTHPPVPSLSPPSSPHELPSGAFLTEAAWGQQEEEGEYKEQKEEEEGFTEQKNESKEPPTATFEEKSSDSCRSLVLHSSSTPSASKSARAPHRHRRSSSSSSSQSRMALQKTNATTTLAPPIPPSQRPHLFSYQSLFGSGTLRLRQRRQEQLAAIEKRYDEALMHRELERVDREMQQQRVEEERRAEREAHSEMLQRAKHDTKLARLRTQLEREKQRAQRDRDRQLEREKVQSERREKTKQDASFRKCEHDRLIQLRTAHLIQTHRDIEQRWKETENECIERLECERKKRREEIRRQHDQPHHSGQERWMREIEQLGLQDPLLRLRTIERLKQKEILAEQHRVDRQTLSFPYPLSSSRSMSPPQSAREEILVQRQVLKQQQRGGGSAGVVGTGGSACTARLPSLPHHGKGLPRHPNRINSFRKPLPPPTAANSARMSHSSGGEGRRGRAEDGQNGSVTFARSHSASSPSSSSSSPCSPWRPGPNGRNKPTMSRSSKNNHFVVVSGGYNTRSPSSKYVIPRTKKSSMASCKAASNEGEEQFKRRHDKQVSENDPEFQLHSASFLHPTHTPLSSHISFWPSELECLMQLEPTVTVAPTPRTTSGKSVKEMDSSAIVEEQLLKQLESEFLALFKPDTAGTSTPSHSPSTTGATTNSGSSESNNDPSHSRSIQLGMEAKEVKFDQLWQLTATSANTSTKTALEPSDVTTASCSAFKQPVVEVLPEEKDVITSPVSPTLELN